MSDASSANQPLVLPAANTGMFGKNEPGTLILADGKLRFETPNGVAFDVPVGELAKLAFSMGDSVFKVTVKGTKYRFYFGEGYGDRKFDETQSLSTKEGLINFRDSKVAGKTLKGALGI